MAPRLARWLYVLSGTIRIAHGASLTSTSSADVSLSAAFALFALAALLPDRRRGASDTVRTAPVALAAGALAAFYAAAIVAFAYH